ncbi:MAG: carbamoyltransferase HypF [Gemmatimonadales bacterium]
MTATPASEPRAAVRLHVRGVVQGVGFRPFVHRLADRHRLAGWVRNTAGEVEIEVEGDRDAIDRFTLELQAMAPVLARIEDVEGEAHEPLGADGFSIMASRDAADERQPVSPDVAVCGECLRELRDPADRRYRYPFITCTDCGPRFTVIDAMPYDRERTSMRAFAQCPRCLGEYTRPGDRRYHSETNSCPACGPRLWVEIPGEGETGDRGEDGLRRVAAALIGGKIAAIRGLGGFHLAVDATSETAVARLRQRKHREAKPLAVMTASVEAARALAWVGPAEEDLLAGPERPVVLLERKPECPLAPSVSPGLGTVGVMLPYTPVHHLLLELVGRPLVMTSGNASEEPIAIGNGEARERLGGIADVLLLHDREIVSRYDDSVVRFAAGAPRFIRRARGYAPLPLRLPVASPEPLVAVGPHLKNTFTLVHEDTAYVSQHVGDLENLETLGHFHESLHALERLFRVQPRAVVRDLHPGYLSTRVAEELGLEKVIPVQHHHAHTAAVMAEHGRTDPVIGLAFDGTGYGDDGLTWGAEVLHADLSGYRRLGQLRYAPLPGGDLAARMPWRAALGYLSLEPSAGPAFACAFEGVDPKEREIAQCQVAAGVNSPAASSMGRLFDAAAAILGVRRVSDYEGQAAMELESLAGRRVAREIRTRIADVEGRWIIDPVHLLIELGERRLNGEDPADLAADFHASVAWAATRVVRWASALAGASTVVLSGGVFQNARLLESMQTRLADLGLTVLTPQRLSANDGAISYGQAAVAAARLAGRESRVQRAGVVTTGG